MRRRLPKHSGGADMKILYPVLLPPHEWSLHATGWPVLAIVMLSAIGCWDLVKFAMGLA